MDENLLSTLRGAVDSGPRARFVALFGSAVRDELRSDSDVDLGWLPDDPEVSLTEELDFQASLTLAVGRDVDLVRLDRTSTICRMEVVRFGVLVAGDRDAWIRFRAEAIAEFLDFEPALRDASERFRRRLSRIGEEGRS